MLTTIINAIHTLQNVEYCYVAKAMSNGVHIVRTQNVFQTLKDFWAEKSEVFDSLEDAMDHNIGCGGHILYCDLHNNWKWVSNTPLV